MSYIPSRIIQCLFPIESLGFSVIMIFILQMLKVSPRSVRLNPLIAAGSFGTDSPAQSNFLKEMVYDLCVNCLVYPLR